MSTESLKNLLKTAISQAQSKSAEQTADSSFDKDLLKAKVTSAQSNVKLKEGRVNSYQLQLDDVQKKLSPPPTKQESQGKKTVTVVDKQEVRKLESQKTQITAQINQAKSDVEDARAEANKAANEAIQLTGLSQDKQNEITNLTSKADAIKASLQKGDAVDEKKIEELTTGFKTLSDSLTKENNAGGLLSTALYDPLAKTMNDIIKLLDNPVTKPTTNNVPPAGTLDRKAYDIGLRGDKITKVVDFTTLINNMGGELNRGQTISQERLQDMNTKFKEIDGFLTPEQKNSDTMKELYGHVKDLKTKTNFTG